MQPRELCKVWFCCCWQGSSSHLSVQIACKLFNSHSVANKIGHSVLAFLPAGMDTDHQPNLTTMHKNHNKASQQNFIYELTECVKCKKHNYLKTLGVNLIKEHFCNHKAKRDLQLSLLKILKTTFCMVFAFVRNTLYDCLLLHK